MMRSSALGLVLIGLLSGVAAAQERPTPWRDDPLFQRLAAALDPVPAIDIHTHLLEAGRFNPVLATAGPLMIRSTHPWLASMVKTRFGVTVSSRGSCGISAIPR